MLENETHVRLNILIDAFDPLGYTGKFLLNSGTINSTREMSDFREILEVRGIK